MPSNFPQMKKNKGLWLNKHLQADLYWIPFITSWPHDLLRFMFEPWSWQISIRLWFALDMNNLSILVMWTDISTRPLHRQILCTFVTQLVVASTDSHSNISKYLLGSYIPKRCCGFQTCSFNYQALLFLLFSRCKVKSESWITQLVRFRI